MKKWELALGGLALIGLATAVGGIVEYRYVKTSEARQISTVELNNDGIPDLIAYDDLGKVTSYIGKGDGNYLRLDEYLAEQKERSQKEIDNLKKLIEKNFVKYTLKK